MGHFVIWTDEQSEALRAFIAGGLSYEESAEKINKLFGGSFSRNAAIGKGKRLGLISPAKPPGKRIVRRPDPFIRPFKRPVPIPPKPPRAVIELRCAEIEPLHLDLLDLEPHHCRWPYGVQKITFCGHSKMVGSYCLAHFQLSVGPGTASERAAA